MPSLIIIVLNSAMSVAGVVVALISLRESARALKAKQRAHEKLSGMWPSELHTRTVDARELAQLRARIERALDTLPETDRVYVQRGLSQKDPVATASFIKELADA